MNDSSKASGMFALTAAVLADEGKPASERDLADFARDAQNIRTIAETQINKAIRSCKRARANHLELLASQPTGRGVLRSAP